MILGKINLISHSHIEITFLLEYVNHIFRYMKEILSKVVSALEDKAGSDLIGMSGFKDGHVA